MKKTWSILWFYIGVLPGITALFVNHLHHLGIFNLCFYSMLAFIAILAKFFGKTKNKYIPYLLVAIILLINLINFISIYFSPVLLSNISQLYGYAIITLLSSFYIILIFCLIGNDSDLFYSMGKAFSIGTFFTIITPIVLNGPSVLLSFRYGGGDIILQPNIIGFYAALTLVFNLGKIWGNNNLISYFFISISGITLLLTMSKTTIIALVVALVTIWFLSNMKEKIINIYICISFIIIFSIPFYERFITQINNYFQNSDVSSTLSGRTIIWDYVINISQEHSLLGYGFASFRQVFANYSYLLGQVEIANAHNAYLQVFLQTGYIGLYLYIFLVIVFLKEIILLLKYRKNRLVQVWVALSIILLIRSITEVSFGNGSSEYVIFITLIFLGKYIRRQLYTNKFNKEGL